MTKMVIIGTGKVARHLYQAFTQQAQITVSQVVGRNLKALAYFAKSSEITSDFDSIQEADIYIMAISDDAIAAISNKIGSHNKLIVHTSGSVALNALPKSNRRGVFYPLQTFSEDRNISFKGIPICIEAEDKEDIDFLKSLAETLKAEVFVVSSEQRKAMHLAAVFVNNFTNHLFTIAHSICEEHKVPFSILRPLINETSEKIRFMSPYDAQTGPARRGDLGTMEKHLQRLKNDHYKEIYSLISTSISETYETKL